MLIFAVMQIIIFREDEHNLIAQYCQSLNGGSETLPSVPRSPVQIMVAIDADQRHELETMIK